MAAVTIATNSQQQIALLCWLFAAELAVTLLLRPYAYGHRLVVAALCLNLFQLSAATLFVHDAVSGLTADLLTALLILLDLTAIGLFVAKAFVIKRYLWAAVLPSCCTALCCTFQRRRRPMSRRPSAAAPLLQHTAEHGGH